MNIPVGNTAKKRNAKPQEFILQSAILDKDNWRRGPSHGVMPNKRNQNSPRHNLRKESVMPTVEEQNEAGMIVAICLGLAVGIVIFTVVFHG